MRLMVNNIDKAEKLLPEFFSKYQSNIIPATEFRRFLQQHGIDSAEISFIIVNLSAKGKLYTYKGSNGRVYLIKDPKSFNMQDFLMTSMDPVYGIYAYINSLLTLYAKSHTYIEIRDIYRMMRKEFGIKHTKWFSIVKFAKALMSSGYFDGFASGTRYNLRPTQKFFNEYPSGFTHEDALAFYEKIFPYLWNPTHNCYNAECMKIQDSMKE